MNGKAEPTTNELWQIIQEQREQIRRQESRLQDLEVRLDVAGKPAGSDIATTRAGKNTSPWSRLSRAKLLKGGASGIAALAGVELAGSLAATSAEAAEDTSYTAGTFYGDGRSSPTIGFKTGTYTTDYTGYDYGVKAHGTFAGVYGIGSDPSSIGVKGETQTGWGVYGNSSGTGGIGVKGFGGYGPGVQGTGNYVGVAGLIGLVDVPPGINAAIYGNGTRPDYPNPPFAGYVGVQGVSDTNTGVLGTSTSGAGVRGSSASSIGVHGASTASPGVEGISSSSYGGVFTSVRGGGMIAEQVSTLTGNNGISCLTALRNGTNSSLKAYNYSGPLIYGNDHPTNAGGGSTPESTGPLLQLDKNGSTKLKVDGSGNLTLGGTVTLTPTTANSASAGSISPPSQVAGYLVISIAGTQYKVPYYNL